MKFLHLALIVLISVVSGGLAGKYFSSNHIQNSKETAYDRILRTGVIRCGYINWMPVIGKNPNSGQMEGYWVDYIEALAKAMELKVEWTEELNLSTYLQDLNNGRYDLECAGGWPNAVRGKFIYYTDPVVYSPLVPFVHANDKRFDSGLKTLEQSGLTAAVVDGDTSQVVRRSRFPNMKEISIAQNSSIAEYFMMVATGKADVTFSDSIGALEYMKNNPGKVRALPYPLRLVPQNIGVPLGDDRLLNMLNTAQLQLQMDGTTDRILDNYEKFPGMFNRIKN